MVTIPEIIWTAMIDAFATVRPGMERVAYLDGVGGAGEGTVTTVVIPNADLHRTWYDVSPEAMSEAAQHMRRTGLVRLAQVHTHGGADCRHSSRDDEKAYSQKPGALSLVLPYHGTRRPQLGDACTHHKTDHGWVLVEPSEVGQYLRCIPSLIDLRRVPWSASQTGMKATLADVWRQWTRRLRSRSRSR